MSEPVALKYRAFLSYAHADTSWAKWLHRNLEGFHIEEDLVGRTTEIGLVPPSLRPIFRDREDFSGGRTLLDATIAALDQSAAPSWCARQFRPGGPPSKRRCDCSGRVTRPGP